MIIMINIATKFLDYHKSIINALQRTICLNGSTFSDCWPNFPFSFNLAQTIFDTLDKSSQCSSKREQKFVLLVALDRYDYWAGIDMKKSPKYFEM